jgi:hypothetical protein
LIRTTLDPRADAAVRAFGRLSDPSARLARARAALRTGDSTPAYVALADGLADAATLALAGRPESLAELVLLLDRAGPWALEAAPAPERRLLTVGCQLGWFFTHVAPEARDPRSLRRRGRELFQAVAEYRQGRGAGR